MANEEILDKAVEKAASNLSLENIKKLPLAIKTASFMEVIK